MTGTTSRIAGQGVGARPWAQLTPVGRQRRLRRLAETALGGYDDLAEARLSFLRAGDNLLYRVVAPNGDRFLLRLQRFSRRDADETRSELCWLTALCHEGGLLVPEPIQTRDGFPFVEVVSDDVPEPHRCVLMRWVSGRQRTVGMTPADARDMGACMARLHEFARAWSAPPGFARPRWEPERWLDAASPLWLRGAEVYTRDELAIFAAAARRIRADLLVLGATSETYGMIHADLAPSNVVFAEGNAHAIDFEECGWGYYLFDVAVTLTALEDYCEHGADLWEAFLAGYQGSRPPLGANAAFIETFLALVSIKIVAWTLGWDDPALRPRGPAYLARAVTQLRQYTEGTRPVEQIARVKPPSD